MNLSTIILLICLPLLAVTLLLVFVRLARGPHLLDRILALDFMAVVVVGILGAYAIATAQQSYLDVAMVVALLSFLGTIGFTYYVERVR
jgi:multicomponent Na+:H+ antiporter subunit F